MLTDAGIESNLLASLNIDDAEFALNWITSHAPVGEAITGGNGQLYFEPRDEAEYRNSFINIADYYGSGVHDVLVASGYLSAETVLRDIVMTVAMSSVRKRFS